MLRTIFFIMVAFGLILASAPDARADMCFRYQKSGGGILVAKGKFPLADNTCEPLALYEVGGGFEGAATGSI